MHPKNILCLILLNVTVPLSIAAETDYLDGLSSQLLEISKLDWPNSDLVTRSLDGRGKTSRYLKTLKRLKNESKTFQCGEAKVKGVLLQCSLVGDDLWLQIRPEGKEKPISVNATQAAQKASKRFAIDGLDINKFVTEVRLFTDEALDILESAKEKAAKQRNINAAMAKEAAERRAEQMSFVEDANPGQNSQHFDRVLNFPSDYEGKTMRWLGRYMGIEKTLSGHFQVGMNFKLASKMVVTNSDPGFVMPEAMAREISRHGLKPHDAQIRVYFRVEKIDATRSGYCFKVLSIMFPPLSSQTKEALSVVTQEARANTPIGRGSWCKITVDGKTKFTTNYQDFR